MDKEYERALYSSKSDRAIASAKALAKMGTPEAKDVLLGRVSSPGAYIAKIWPFIIPLLEEEDAPRLLEIDYRYCWRERTAVKYKLPERARKLIVSYMKKNIGELDENILYRATASRYQEISETAFQLCLKNDSDATRKALECFVKGHGDGRKAGKRAVISYEEMLSRLSGPERKRFLEYSSMKGFDKARAMARDLLKKEDPKGLAKMVRGNDWLSPEDLLFLREDGSRYSRERILKDARQMAGNLPSNPSKPQRKKLGYICYFLMDLGPGKPRRLFLTLLKETGMSPLDYPDLFGSLCYSLADSKSRYALRTLRTVADNSWGECRFAALGAIMQIEGISPYDPENVYACKARDLLKQEQTGLSREDRRMSSDEYVYEDPREKVMDSSCLRRWDGDLNRYRYLIFGWYAGDKQ